VPCGRLGGRVQELAWDGELIWDFEFAGADHQLHHDIEPLPNGNLLMIVWERKSREEAIAAGRDPATVNDKGLWADFVIEVRRTGKTTGEIVWEWHAWDHLVQAFDPGKANYGTVAEQPRRIDLNVPDWTSRLHRKDFDQLKGFAYLGSATTRSSNPDFMHTNSVAYNAERDEIVLSVLGYHEIWIIGHGGQGDGDLLYRWGNPEVYGRGGPEDWRLYAQHDAHWIAAGCPGARPPPRLQQRPRTAGEGVVVGGRDRPADRRRRRPCA